MKLLKRILGNSPLDDDLLTLLRKERYDLASVRHLVSAGADVCCIEVRKDVHHGAYKGYTPLHHASHGRNPDSAEVVKFLLSRCAGVNATSKYGHTPLSGAALSGNTEIIDILIKAGARVNAVNSSGQTPIHNAAEFGNYQVVKRLIEAGADVNAQSPARGTCNGDTPLHSAVSVLGEHQQKIKVIELLLRQGARLQARTKRGPTGETPLDRAEYLFDMIRARGDATEEEVARREEIIELLRRWVSAGD